MLVVFLKHFPPCFWGQGLLLNPDFTKLVGQQTWGSVLSSQHWDYRHTAGDNFWCECDHRKSHAHMVCTSSMRPSSCPETSLCYLTSKIWSYFCPLHTSLPSSPSISSLVFPFAVSNHGRVRAREFKKGWGHTKFKSEKKLWLENSPASA